MMTMEQIKRRATRLHEETKSLLLRAEILSTDLQKIVSNQKRAGEPMRGKISAHGRVVRIA